MTTANAQSSIASNTEATTGIPQQPSATNPRSLTAIDAFRQNAWTEQAPRLPKDWSTLTPERRYDYASRQAPVEMDILTTKAPGLSLDELQTIYPVQFPFMGQYDAERCYDANERIMFTPSKGLPHIGLRRKANKGDTSYALRMPEDTNEGIATGWNDVRNSLEATIIRGTLDDTLPNGPIDRKIKRSTLFDSPYGNGNKKPHSASTVGDDLERMFTQFRRETPLQRWTGLLRKAH